MEKNIRRCKNSGVTLIALIITIIVMLILMTVIIVGVEQEGLFQIADKVAYDANAEIEAGYKLSGGSVEIEGVTYNSLQEYLDITSNNFTYSVSDITEEDIAPTDLFNYEIINNGAIGAISPLSSLPTKTARITGIKPEYCNIRGYNPETNLSGLTNTNYEIVYNGETISDTLIIPYQVDIEGELYKITEVCLTVAYNEQNIYASMPYIHTIIYPNTVEKIYTPEGIYMSEGHEYSSTLTEVILPDSLISIGQCIFFECASLTNITIPAGVLNIGERAF